ncbi:hypothetical protein [Pseudomonas sp. Irchel 3E13]|uniref:hypothetical protein n=1 Tax=Pseudomonas sp. Irchel 3E13 TaxID=2008975 RepID=UPI000BA47612|nr:hypothetical protein [Pseudomonas sp. Irchel 3E13]
MTGKTFYARRVQVDQGDPRIWPPGEAVVLASDYNALLAEVEALRADAARHRYLRDIVGLRYKRPGVPIAHSAEASDQLIDADRLQAPPA